MPSVQISNFRNDLQVLQTGAVELSAVECITAASQWRTLFLFLIFALPSYWLQDCYGGNEMFCLVLSFSVSGINHMGDSHLPQKKKKSMTT